MIRYTILAAVTAATLLTCAPALRAQEQKKERGARPGASSDRGHRGRESGGAPAQRGDSPRRFGGPQRDQQAAPRDSGRQGRTLGPGRSDREMRQSPPSAGQPAARGQAQPPRPERQGPPPSAQPGWRSQGQPPRPNRETRQIPPPSGPPGGQRQETPGAHYRGHEVIRTRNGGQVYRAPDRTIREVRTPGGAVIRHAPGGFRHVEVVRPGGRVVVARAHGRVGYVQRPIVVRNVTYVQRTYVYQGASYVRVYRPWSWRGITFHVYTPVRYYRPAFYYWAWRPWPRPVYYSWGLAGRPWFGYYGGWFAPYPYYSSPLFWLTDYLIARTLEQAYEERMAERAAAAQANYYPQTQLTPEVKHLISEEVRRQLEHQRAQQGQYTSAANAPPPLFSDNASHVFVVANPLQVDDGAMGCTLTEGDVLQMTRAPGPDSPVADVVVLAGKPQDCRQGSRVQVSLNDLQEMHNQMVATLDQGLNDLQSRQGQSGIPALPDEARGVTSAPVASAVVAEANAAGELGQAAQDAENAEREVVSQAEVSGTVRITLGMSIADVERAMGSPREVADLGAKKVYVYPDMKIIFTDGRVSDVQ